MRIVYLNIAEMAVPKEPAVISTVLGSCVSVCIFSPDKRLGGMIHYGLPSPEYAHPNISGREEIDPLRFGNLAVPALAREVTRLAGRGKLCAKIIGGAAIVSELKQARKIGQLNIEVAENTLKEIGIPIVGRDVGGEFGKKVFFYTDSGRVRTAPVNESYSMLRAENQPDKRKKVLIVDDSKTIQRLLKRVLDEDPGLEVVGVASRPSEAAKMISTLKPDVMTLDIHMPEMDGVTFLERTLPHYPIPTVMITSISMEASDYVFRALELGAVDYIQKPSSSEIYDLTPVIREKVRAAAAIKLKQKRFDSIPLRSRIRSNGDLKHVSSVVSGGVSGDLDLSILIAIGASTGGTEALKEVLIRLPKEIPPVVIVQHIPPIFSTAFAKRLNELCPFEVKEAETGDAVRKGRVLIAPGGSQMALEPDLSAEGRGLRVKVTQDPPVNRHKPSVDYLFDSVAIHARNRAIGVILTGMGNDGASGLFRMKKAGARTLSQDEASCVVYGMPKTACEMGAVDEVHPLEKIPEVLTRWLRKKGSV